MKDIYKIGLFIPMSGDAGVWGVSCRSCAELAVEEINNQGGIRGHEVALHIEDAGSTNPFLVAKQARYLAKTGQINAIVGMHTSDVRDIINHNLNLEIPYIYTPLWEGHRHDQPSICIGERPEQQLRLSMEWLIEKHNLTSWMLVGHDYVWPRVSNRYSKTILKSRNQSILDEIYVPFQHKDFTEIIDRAKKLKPSAILLTLVGQDSILFNRQFGKSGLGASVLRFSTAIEENMLLAIGQANSERLFCSAGYFAGANTARNDSFRNRYYDHFTEQGPPLGSIGQSLYEGVHLLKNLYDRDDEKSIPFAGAREGHYVPGGEAHLDQVFVAEARGHEFSVVKRFSGDLRSA